MGLSTSLRRAPMLACLAALSLAGAAQAAELTLFENPNFGGVQVTLRGYTPNVARVGFGDRTSSVVVDSGRWEVCTDADFKGKCVILGRGEYPTLDRTLNDNISSAREVGTYGDRRGSYNDWGRGTIQLFSRPGFAGRNVTLEADSAALSGNNFDDRASSLVVTRGTWELCADPGFRGGCRTYPPGRYADLGYGMAREASSVRLIRPTRDAPVVISPGQPLPGDGPARAILYSEPDLRGMSLALSGPVNDLARSDFDDLAASLIVESGTWIACRDTYFRGECRTYGPGRYDNNETRNFLSRISSIRPGGGVVPPQVPPAPPPRDTGVELFADANFRGDRVAVDGPIADLTRANFNDRAESVIVHVGTWEICSDAGFNGSCAVFAPGSYARIGGLARQVSSLRRVR
ncbi:MAG: beta/gamma crystallin family protein [Burkholderiales bacterium]|nr:beta/gamma crystallin family protein [Burkholderiales bacterium]